MLADDLLSGIAFHPPGTSIPVDNDAARVEHVNGIILYGLDQQPKPPFAFVKRLLRLPSFGNVAGDFGKADSTAVRHAHRPYHNRCPEAAAVPANAPSLVFGAASSSRPR